MKKMHITEVQVIGILNEQSPQGQKASEICHKDGIREPTFYNSHNKYAGVKVYELKRLKEMKY